ncbi:hypothetical protein GYMLUDRAFT_242475 [Collybiopsis luxurians FD-317 M1]|uniref:Uncharacterized protein n=1 Tax=Collybiopsis luxurians FD-317 M1 TaxID=944289 RepID=A0A0D0C3V2_9AGAR|nr:hypothetical protein GYMLUDRAFT_242475 [Collybiopsis luxurians FD-317 M1]
MSTVWFMVDDTDPRLVYSGSWTFVPDTSDVSGTNFDSLSFSGPAFNSTLHSTTGNVSISFRFNGSYFGVYGSSDGITSNSSGFPSGPNIECLLDNVYASSPLDSHKANLIDNNILACSSWIDSLPGVSSPPSTGEHELLIKVTNYPAFISGETTAWYFDYITYESPPNPVLDGEILQAGNPEVMTASNYSALTFGPGWTYVQDEFEGPAYTTSTRIPGSNATVRFNGRPVVALAFKYHIYGDTLGTSISLYGDLSSPISNTAAYQVDDQAPVMIQLPGYSDNITLSNQLLFTASDLKVGEHTLVVTFNGSQSGMPLDIDHFYIQSLTAAQQDSLRSSSTSSTSSTSTSTGSAISNSSGHLDLGAIVGTVLGSLMTIILLIVVIMWWRRSKRRTEPPVTLTPFDSEGFITTPLTLQDLAFTSSPRLRRTSLSPGPIDERIVAQRSRESGSHTLLTMKYEQRIAALQEQIRRQQDQRHARYNVSAEALPRYTTE